MWIILSSIVLILAIAHVRLYLQKIKLQKKKELLEPMVEAVENIKDILYYCETTPKLRYIYLSPNIDLIFGHNTWKDHIDNPDIVFDMVHPDDYDILIEKKKGTLDFNKPIKVRFLNDRGEYVWFEEYVTPVYENGKFVAVQGLFRNINEKVLLQQQLEYKSTHDPLTNLYNREYFQMRMQEFNAKACPITVIVVDLDDLKKINDKYGHQTGDQLILEAAYCLQTFADEETIIARIGGDEFYLLLPNKTLIEAQQYIEKVQQEMQSEYNQYAFKTINMSVGYAYSENCFNRMDVLLSKADSAMYAQKKKKKVPAHY